MILVCKGTYAPVAPLSKVRGGSAPLMHPRSGVPALSPNHQFAQRISYVEHYSVHDDTA